MHGRAEQINRQGWDAKIASQRVSSQSIAASRAFPTQIGQKIGQNDQGREILLQGGGAEHEPGTIVEFSSLSNPKRPQAGPRLAPDRRQMAPDGGPSPLCRGRIRHIQEPPPAPPAPSTGISDNNNSNYDEM